MENRLVANVEAVLTPRARRYGIGTAIRYRTGGANVWREGTLRNMSISGVLLGTGEVLDPDTAIEMRFSLPLELANGEAAAEVLCRAIVVRCSPAESPEDETKIAAKIVSSRFLRQSSKK